MSSSSPKERGSAIEPAKGSADSSVSPEELAPAPASQIGPARSTRLSAIDIVRGLFMVIIIAGHASTNLDKSDSSQLFDKIFELPFHSGTVGFTVVSGTLLGSFIAGRPDLR